MYLETLNDPFWQKVILIGFSTGFVFFSICTVSVLISKFPGNRAVQFFTKWGTATIFALGLVASVYGLFSMVKYLIT